MEASQETVAELRSRLLDPSLPIERRFRSLFSLRNLRGDGPREALEAALEDESCLLAHEAAFALGQMQDVAAVPSLRTVLQSPQYHPMVRHEAAEALGALGSSESLALLEAGLGDPAPEVRETCELALERIRQSTANGTASSSSGTSVGIGAVDGNEGSRESSRDVDSGQSPFLSVDPARPAPSDASTEDLRRLLLEEGAPMYDRYAALFALRNRRSPEAVEAVVAALHASSALLRHEVAYVLGQLQDRAAVEALMATLAKLEEHPMVRHEAAEALGAIADVASVELLRKFQKDPEPIVSQSCDVALDMLEFELQEGAFQYADVQGTHLAPSAVACS